MQKKRYIYWKDNDMWLGYLDEYPDYMTKGQTIEELQLRERYRAGVTWVRLANGRFQGAGDPRRGGAAALATA